MEFLEIWAPFKDNWKYVCIMLQMNALLCESAGSAFFCHGFTAIMCKLQPDFQLEGAAVSEKCYDGNSSSFQLEIRLELAHNCHEAMAKKNADPADSLKSRRVKSTNLNIRGKEVTHLSSANTSTPSQIWFAIHLPSSPIPVPLHFFYLIAIRIVGWTVQRIQWKKSQKASYAGEILAF